VAAWHWRALLPLSALLELAAFLIFQLAAMRAHHDDRRGGEPRAPGARLPGWALGAPVRSLSRRFCPQAKRRDPREGTRSRAPA